MTQRAVAIEGRRPEVVTVRRVQPFKTALIFGMGYTQDEKDETGLDRLWASCRELMSPTTWVRTPMNWDANVTSMAAQIIRHTTPQTVLVGAFYSWGAGWLFPRLADELANQEHAGHRRRFAGVALCDPVYRSKHIAFVWRSVSRYLWVPKITVPDSVGEVVWTRQRENVPQGHDLKRPDGSKRLIADPEKRDGIIHEDMDDDPVFHRMFLDLVSRLA